MRKIFIFLLIGMFMLSFAFAFEFDDVKSYDERTRTFTTKNCNVWLVTCLVPGDTLVTAQLTTPLNVKVAMGEDRLVGEFTFQTSDNLLDVFGGLYLEDLKNGQTISRREQYKYKVYKNVSVDDYKNVCEDTELPNKTTITECSKVKVGSHIETQVEWIPILKLGNTFVPNTIYEIGIFLDVEQGDHGDWVPEFYSTKVSQWATWSAGLNVNLISYYKLDGTPDPVIDSNDYSNGTNSGTTSGQLGKINYSYFFSGATEQSFNSGLNSEIVNTDWSTSFWINDTNIGTSQFIMGNRQASTGNYWFLQIYANGSIHVESGDMAINIGSDTLLTNNVWYHVALTIKGNNASLFINGVLDDADTTVSLLTTNSDRNVTFGRWYDAWTTDNGMDGYLDEIGIWNRSLSAAEITQLYNGGTGITHVKTVAITLNSPDDNYNTTTSVTFNATAAVNIGATLVNMSLWTNETGSFALRNITNITGTENTTTWSRSFADGSYLWNGQVCDSNDICTFSLNRTLNVKTTKPLIDVETPTGVLNYSYIGGNETLNVTFTDGNLDSCWYNYNGTNTTIPGCLTTVKNSTSFILETDNTNITIYANDTFGNENSTYFNWSYLLLEENSSYNAVVTEGASEVFTANMTLSSGLRVESVDFYYNGTSSTGSFSEYATNKYTVSVTKIIPAVTADTNLTFYWNLTFENGQSQETSSKNQTVLDLAIDDCSTYTNILFNFTMVDEDNQTFLNGTTDNTRTNIDLTLSNVNDLTEVINISQNYTQVNPAKVCVKTDLADSSFRVDAIVEYQSDGRFIEFYNIQNYTLTNTTDNQNITLYNLNSSAGQEFQVTYKDSNFNTVPGAIIQIQRKYVDEGVFKTIEIPLIGGAGSTIAHLIRNDVLYNLIIIKDGTVLGTFTNVVASCQNPTISSCEININSFTSGSSTQDFSTNEDFTSTLTYNKTTRVVASTYAIISGVSALTTLNVTLWDSYLNASVCSDSLTSAGGTLSCTIPVSYGNTTVVVTITSGGVVKRKAALILADSPENIYGNNLVFIGLIIMFLIIGISVNDNPLTLGVMLVFGTIILIVLNVFTNTGWYGPGATILWFIIAVIILLIKGSNRQ